MSKTMDDQDQQGQARQEPPHDDDAQGAGDGGEGSGGPVDWQAEALKWKSLSRKHEGQAKANATAAKRLQELEDADKTELQKATDRASAAESDHAKTKGELMRLRVALRLGLTEAQAKRLVGETEEDLEADAEDLLKSFGGVKGAGDGGPTRPKERLRSGAAPDEEPDETDPRKLAAAVPRL